MHFNPGTTNIHIIHQRATNAVSSIHCPPHTHDLSKRSSQTRIAGALAMTRCWEDAYEALQHRQQTRTNSRGWLPSNISLTTSRRSDETCIPGGNNDEETLLLGQEDKVVDTGGSPNTYLTGWDWAGVNVDIAKSVFPNSPSSIGFCSTWTITQPIKISL